MSGEVVFFVLLGIVIVIAVLLLSRRRAPGHSRKKSVAPRQPQVLDKMRELHAAYARNQDDLVSLYQLARLQIENGMAQDGVTNVMRLLDRNLSGSGVSHVKSVVLLAEGQLALGNKDDAYKQLQVAYGLDATDIEVNLKLAAILAEAGNIKDAFAYASRVVKMDPDNPEGWLTYGLSAFQLGNTEVAIEALEKAIELNPGHFRAVLSLAELYVRRGNTVEAETCFNQALKNAADQNERAETFYKWGVHKVRQLDHEQARTLFGHALKESATNDLRKKILQELVALYEQQKNVPRILSAMKEYLKLDPSREEYRKKLDYYEEVGSNIRLQKYEFMGLTEFSQFCVKLAGVMFKHDGNPVMEINPDGSVDVTLYRTTKTQAMTVLFRFLRSKGETGEMILRDLYAKMKAQNGSRAVFVTNSSFTEGAVAFSKSRMVNLVTKDELIKYLERI